MIIFRHLRYVPCLAKRIIRNLPGQAINMEKIRETARLKGIGSRMFRQAGAIVLLAVTIGVLVNQIRSHMAGAVGRVLRH